jgi:hypothetical protein
VNDALIASLGNPRDRDYLKQKNEAGERLLTKKEASRRAFEVTRWRELKVGDIAAAKLQSRDMWILCRGEGSRVKSEGRDLVRKPTGSVASHGH